MKGRRDTTEQENRMLRETERADKTIIEACV